MFSKTRGFLLRVPGLSVKAVCQGIGIDGVCQGVNVPSPGIYRRTTEPGLLRPRKRPQLAEAVWPMVQAATAPTQQVRQYAERVRRAERIIRSLVLGNSPSQIVVQELTTAALRVVENASKSLSTPPDRSSTASRPRHAAARASGRGLGGCGLAQDRCSLCVADESVPAAACRGVLNRNSTQSSFSNLSLLHLALSKTEAQNAQGRCVKQELIFL